MTRPQPLSPAEAHEAIQRLLGLRNCLGWTKHAEDRAADRDFNADDVLRVLTKGTVKPNPEWDSVFQNWIYTVCGRDYDGERLAVVIALEPTLGRITIITGKDY